MQNGQPLPDEQSDGFKSCSRWKLQRLPGMPAASLIQTQASVAGRSSLTCTYSRTSTSATILQNRVQAVPPGSQANCMRTDILVEKLYRRTVNTHNKEINNSLMKPFFLLVFLLCSAGAFSQKVALKNNLTYDTLKTTNLSLEFSMRRKWTLGTQVGMNFFFYTRDPTSSLYKEKKFSHWLVRPELCPLQRLVLRVAHPWRPDEYRRCRCPLCASERGWKHERPPLRGLFLGRRVERRLPVGAFQPSQYRGLLGYRLRARPL